MEIEVDKKELKYFKNYLSFQKDRRTPGLKRNFQNFMYQVGVEEMYCLNINNISDVVYADLGKPVLDVFFGYLSQFEKPWLRITLDDKMDDRIRVIGGPDCYIDALDDNGCPCEWIYQTTLPSDFILELLSQKLPNVKRVVDSINLIGKSEIVLKQIELETLTSYLFPSEMREQIIPLSSLPYLIEQADEITHEEIKKFDYKTEVVIKRYPFNPSLCERQEKPIIIRKNDKKNNISKTLRLLFRR